MFYRLSCIVFALFALTACSSKPIFLKKEACQQIHSIDHVIAVPQNNLDITVTPTNGGSGGVIGVLVASAIDASRRSNAEKQARPIIEELRGFDFRSVMLNAIKTATENSTDFNFDVKSRIENVETDTDKRILVSQSQSNAVLLTIVKYELNTQNLIVTASSSMYPNMKSLEKFKKTPNNDAKITDDDQIYSNVFTFKKQAITAGNIRSSLTESAQHIAKQLISDISTPI